MGIKETRVPTFGEQLIGVEYQPESEDLVLQVKAKFIEIAEIIKEDYSKGSRHPLKSLLFDHAVGEIVNSQMAVVKLLTLKHYTEDETSGTQSTN